MKNVIFGSGIVGCLARFILGDDWDIVPFGRSRFYSFSPPLADNFVICDQEIDWVMSSLGLNTTPVMYQRSYSVGGELIKQPTTGLADAWLHKMFGGKQPAHARVYLESRNSFFVYGGVRLGQVYQQLQHRYGEYLSAEAAKGAVTAIGPHTFTRGGVTTEFDKAVSTVPLSAFESLCGRGQSTESKDLHYIHLHTKSLDFEGANQAYVVDDIFDFAIVTNVAKERYVFQCVGDIKNPGEYFMPILGNFDLLEGTRIGGAIPLGDMPKLSWMDDMGVYPVGQYAQHDWCADVGSNILRLSRYAGRDFEKAKPKIIA